MPSRKKLTKSPKLSTPKPVTRDRIAAGIGFGSQIKEFCNRQRITPLTEWVVRIYGAE
jgi:hypothetical protein